MSKSNHLITVVGYGSLLSEQDAHRTCPNLINFRWGYLHGFSRYFNKVNGRIGHFESPEKNKAVSVLTIQADNHQPMAVSLFDIPADELADVTFRERDYQPLWVRVQDGEESVSALVFVGWPCEEKYRQHGCPDSHKEVEKIRVNENYSGPLYRDDLQPRPDYLALCLKGAQSLGGEVYENFLDTTFLGDGITSIREYLKENEDATRAKASN